MAVFNMMASIHDKDGFEGQDVNSQVEGYLRRQNVGEQQKRDHRRR